MTDVDFSFLANIDGIHRLIYTINSNTSLVYNLAIVILCTFTAPECVFFDLLSIARRG